MANYSREEAENQRRAFVGVVSTLLVGLGGLAFKGNRERQNLEFQISQKNSQIADLKSGFLGSFLNSEEIGKLEEERDNLIKKRKKY